MSAYRALTTHILSDIRWDACCNNGKSRGTSEAVITLQGPKDNLTRQPGRCKSPRNLRESVQAPSRGGSVVVVLAFTYTEVNRYCRVGAGCDPDMLRASSRAGANLL
eukprot:768301-Hanusia_phi.AAC.2